VKHKVHLRREVPDAGGRGLAAAARAVLERARVGPSELTIVLTDSRRLRRLNARYAGVDAVTDVLAFQGSPLGARSGSRYLGDIVIALPRARAQARRNGVRLTEELSLLTVHATLHLIGHDHGGPAERRRMWRVQSSVLRRLGLDPEKLGVGS
jgi:probable rRNA maturation factor